MTTVDENTPGAVEVTTWHLEITAPSALPGARPPKVAATFVVADRPTVAFAKWLYHEVGGPWYWTDRHQWTEAQWTETVNAPSYHQATCVVGGTPAGYVEYTNRDGDIEIQYFGLVTDVHGLGLGGWFLAAAVEHGFSLEGAHRVWLHTCSLDGPNARANYEARGFTLFHTEVEWRVLD